MTPLPAGLPGELSQEDTGVFSRHAGVTRTVFGVKPERNETSMGSQVFFSGRMNLARFMPVMSGATRPIRQAAPFARSLKLSLKARVDAKARPKRCPTCNPLQA